MDLIGLVTLREELRDDSRIVAAAVARLAGFLEHSAHGGLEAAAFEIARCYNVIEQAALRVARSFENHFDKNHGWHEALLKRMSLEIPGVRPALIPAALKPKLDAIRRFRHLVHHAYDLELKADRVEEMVRIMAQVSKELGGVWDHFIRQVADDNGWAIPK